MSFTDQKPFVVTEKQLSQRWGTRTKDGALMCNICGHKFNEGENARWVYANGESSNGSGNFFTCDKCDGPDVLERGRASFAQAKEMAQQWGIYGPDWQ